MSRVISSGPSLVSLASISNSSMWIEVEEIVLDQLLGHQDGVLEVVAPPRHECDQHVATQSQLTEIGARAIGEHVALFDPLTLLDDRLLADTGVLIRAPELDQLVDIGTELLRFTGVDVFALDADDDALGIDRIDDASPLAQHHRARVTGHDRFEAGADNRRFAAQQGYSLTLHVRTHQGTVGVVVLEETESALRPPKRAAWG